MRRMLITLAAMAALMLALAAPAAAHIIVVTPPGSEGPVHGGWVGGIASDNAQGKALIVGGPPGEEVLLPPSHALGLNTACENLRANGRAAVDIFGPPTPAGCPHGT